MPGPESPIRRIRRARGLSARQLAGSAGIHHSFYARLERGERGASVATLRRIAAALDVRLAALLEEDAYEQCANGGVQP